MRLFCLIVVGIGLGAASVTAGDKSAPQSDSGSIGSRIDNIGKIKKIDEGITKGYTQNS